MSAPEPITTKVSTTVSNTTLVKQYQEKLKSYIETHAGKEGHNPYTHVQTKFANVTKAIKNNTPFTPDEIKLIQSDWEIPVVVTYVDTAKALMADTKLKQPLPGR